MSVAELVQQLVLRCGRRKGHVELLTNEIAYAISEVEESIFHPWFLLSDRARIETVAGEERVGLPTDFLAEYEDGALWITCNNERTPLSKVTVEDIQNADEAEGLPYYYTTTGDSIRLYPVPDDTYTISMLYYKKSGEVNDTNVWLRYASQYIAAVVMFNYATGVRDKNLANLANTQRQRWYDTLLARHTEHAVTNRDRNKGD